MDKSEIYNHYALIIEEDGTWSDLKKIYMKHPQQDPLILKRACQEMTKYVGFCLNICCFYWSESYQKYVQFRDDIDITNYQIKLSYERITITKETDLTTIPYPNIEGLVKMHNLNLRYSQLFNHLLEGHFYLKEFTD